jgi:hypothetical protein
MGAYTSSESVQKLAKMGTVTGRDTTGARVLVTFDGSAGVSQPVKCPESVVVDTGDRVGLVKYEGGVLRRDGRPAGDGDWIITVNYSLQTLCDAMNMFQWGSSGTTTSATFVDMPNSPSVTFTKMRDNTALRIWIGVSLFATVVPTVYHIGMHIASLDGLVSYDEDMFHRAVNNVAHGDSSGWITTGALAAGQYTGTARWLRTSGTGTLTVDSNDSISMHIKEVVS